METIILYPFTIAADNKSSFSQTLQLAKKLAAKVVCFTSISNEDNLDEAYLHLLGLNGHFQTSLNKWQQVEVKIKRIVKVGLLEKELIQYLRGTTIDFIICQPQTNALEESALTELIKEEEKRPYLVTFSTN